MHFDPCFLQNALAFRTHRISYRCNREIWRLSHVWLVVYIIAGTRSSAVLSRKISISLAPYLTTISRISYSVTYTISRIPISLYYILYLFFILFYYILCFTSPAHPSALHLVYIDIYHTPSCGPETIWVYLVCYGITRYYILCRPNIL